MKNEIKNVAAAFGLSGDMDTFYVIFNALAKAEEVVSIVEMVALRGDNSFDESLEQSRRLVKKFANDLRSVVPMAVKAINIANTIFPELVWDLKKAVNHCLVRMKALPEDRSLYGYYERPRDVTEEEVLDAIEEFEYVLVHLYDRDRVMDLVRAARNAIGTLRVRLPLLIKLIGLLRHLKEDITAKFTASIGGSVSELLLKAKSKE